MAINITTDGNGTARVTTWLNVNKLVNASVNQRYYGDAYTVTATPNAGYAFDNMVLDWDIDEEYYDYYQGWTFVATYHQYLGSGGVNPWASQIDNNINTILDPTSIQCYLFEREIYRAATGAQNWERRYTLKNLNLYVTFKHTRPDPTHLIMRATNGLILRGGTQNKILRDD